MDHSTGQQEAGSTTGLHSIAEHGEPAQNQGAQSQIAGHIDDSLRRLSISGPSTSSNLDFFGHDVFQIVLGNPTTAHRLLKFCETRACTENILFLQKVDMPSGFSSSDAIPRMRLGTDNCQVDHYHRVLEEANGLMSEIQSTFLTSDAPLEINIASTMSKRINGDIKQSRRNTFPTLEKVFAGAQEHIEMLIADDIYPKFVKHQLTISAAMALADDKSRYQGAGDCFCLTDPS